MAVAYQTSATTNIAAGVTSVQISRPTGTSDGDILIAAICIADGGGASSVNSVPSGWTLIQDTEPASNANLYSYYKVASSEPANWTWGLSASTVAGGGVSRFDGQSAVTPISTSNEGNQSNDDTPSYATGITPTFSNSMLVFATFSIQNGSQNHSAHAVATSNPTWTEAFDIRTTDTTLSLAYALRPETTSTGAWSLTAGSNGDATDSSSHLLAITPRVDAATSPAVVANTLSIPAPIATGGAATSPAVIVATLAAPPASASVSDPQWINDNKSSAPVWNNPNKS